MKKSFLLFVLLCTQTIQAYSDTPVVGAYYENWSQYRPAVQGRQTFYPNMIDPTIITDLYYAFACFGFVTRSVDPSNPHLTGDYTIQPVEWNDQSVLYPQVMALKNQNPQLRVLLSVGGWSFNDPNDPNGMGAFTYKLFSQMIASPDNRKQFIDSAIAYSHQYGFNGIDVDWEYPGDLTRGGTDADFTNFITFLLECKAAFEAAQPPLLLTYASAAIVPSGVSQKYRDNPTLYFQWLAQCAPHLDRFNLMCYDYHGPFDDPKLTGVNAPLYADTDPASLLFIAETIDNYINNGVPANKIVLGMPIYGHSYAGVSALSPTLNGPGLPFTSAGPAGPSTLQPGLLSYFEIADMVALGQLTFGTDTPTSTAYGYNIPQQEWVSFDTPDTIALKASYAKSKGLLGGMFWAVDNDEYQWSPKYPNVRAGYETLNSSN